jgi:hypothetical protein
MPTKYREV